MKIHIITAYDQNYTTISNITYRTVEKYCQKWRHISQRHKIEDNNPKPHWQKIKFISQSLANGADWCVWIDADAFINNQEYDLRQLLDSKNDLTIANDFNGLNSGVMIWQNTERSRAFLKTIYEQRDKIIHEFEEQQAIVQLLNEKPDLRVEYVPQKLLNAYDYKLYDLENNDGQFNHESFIIHFPGITYPYVIRRTCDILNLHARLPLATEKDLAWLRQKDDNWHRFDVLDGIVRKSGESIEGDCMHEHHNVNSRPSQLIPKQLNIISAAKKATKALEIGFNAGHSTLLMLLANPDLTITCVDNFQHKYTEKCYEYLKFIFRNRINMIRGDSKIVVPEHHAKHLSTSYDLVHIDGSHETTTAQADLANTYPLLELFGTLIWDDVQCKELDHIIEHNARMGRLKEHDVHRTELYPHRIFYKPIAIPPEGHKCEGHPMRIFHKEQI